MGQEPPEKFKVIFGTDFGCSRPFFEGFQQGVLKGRAKRHDFELCLPLFARTVEGAPRRTERTREGGKASEFLLEDIVFDEQEYAEDNGAEEEGGAPGARGGGAGGAVPTARRPLAALAHAGTAC